VKKDDGVDVVGVFVVVEVVAVADDDEAVEEPLLLFPNVGLAGHDGRPRREDKYRFGDVGVSNLWETTRLPVTMVEGVENGIEALAPARDPISRSRAGGARIMSRIDGQYRYLVCSFAWCLSYLSSN
jgi:hypothetical protein